MGACRNIGTMALDFFAGSCGGELLFFVFFANVHMLLFFSSSFFGDVRIFFSSFSFFGNVHMFSGASGIATGYPLDTVKVFINFKFKLLNPIIGVS